jgi:nickel/cobalt exporter
MSRLKLGFFAIACSLGLGAHPMGNFSVNHYSNLRVTPSGVELLYVLDLAEIPTFELLREWNMDRSSPQAELDRKTLAQARHWLSSLKITAEGQPLQARLETQELVLADGAGNLPIARITMHANVSTHAQSLTFVDENYPDRSGWKEIVLEASPGVALKQASQGDKDVSNALTQYPPDPTVAPPQDLRAELSWSVTPPEERLTIPASREEASPVVQPVPQPHNSPPATSPVTMTLQAAPAGAVVRGDYLSRFLNHRKLTLGMIFLAMGVAFFLGAAHALTPGHGKTIVAAYLVGSRGTLKHAVFLGATVTFAHTVSVFALGFATLFLVQYIGPEKITQALGAISGLSIVAIGGWTLYKRVRSSGHSHDHTRLAEEISWGGLAALGASGGLVPCESALVLVLSAIALGRIGLGLMLLVSFSLGLSIVLTGIGVLVLFAKNLIPERGRRPNGILRWLLVASSACVIAIGVIITAVSVGWLHSKWMI